MRNLRLPKFSVPVILGLILAIMIVVALLNQSWFDIVWILISLALGGLITFIFLVPRLLPIEPSREEQSGAYRVLGNYVLGGNVPMMVVRDGRVVSKNSAAKTMAREAKAPPSRLKMEAEETSASAGYGVIVGDSTSVLALRTETGITRIVGPRLNERGRSVSGVAFTEPEEYLDSIIDLRPQVRLAPVQAQTRDGLTLDMKLIVLFTLRGTQARRMRDLLRLREQGQLWPQPFSWRRSSAHAAIMGRRIDFKDGKSDRTEWGDRVLAIAVPRLRQLIGQYKCDELTAPLTADRHPRFKIRDELLAIVRRELNEANEFARESGLQVLFMAVTVMTPPPPVLVQRVAAWQREWSKRKTEIMGRAEAEAMLLREQARAQVQGEMTARINDALQEARASGTNNSDLITLRFLEAMEKMAKDPTTRALLTLDSLKILKQLREMLTPNSAEPSK